MRRQQVRASAGAILAGDRFGAWFIRWVCIICVGGCAGAPAPGPIRYESKEWTYKGQQGAELRSQNYVIYTTCRRQSFVDVLPAFLENCYGAYAGLLPGSASRTEPMPTYLFQRRNEWERFTEEFAPARAETYKAIRQGGYSERGTTVSYYGTQASTLSILAHEGLHQYLEATGRHRIPAWVNEGLACYFESCKFDPTTGTALHAPESNTLRRPRLRDAVVTKTLIPLREVLATNAGHAVLENRRYVQACYGQWWSLTLFLLRPERENPYHGGYRALLAELGSDAMHRRARAYLAADNEDEVSFGEAVFRAYITEDLERFDADYQRYLNVLLDLKAV